jgi:hypothetical protein
MSMKSAIVRKKRVCNFVRSSVALICPDLSVSTEVNQFHSLIVTSQNDEQQWGQTTCTGDLYQEEGQNGEDEKSLRCKEHLRHDPRTLLIHDYDLEVLLAVDRTDQHKDHNIKTIVGDSVEIRYRRFRYIRKTS